MDIGTSEQVFTGVAVFWLGWLALLIPLLMLRRWIFD